MKRSVTVSERGREGHLQYTAPEGSINGHWEFGGGDVVAILSMGTREEWMRSHPWAVEQRADILRYIGDQVVERRAPYCTPEVDEERGTILLRQTSGPRIRVPGTAGSAPTPQEKSAAFVRRFTNLKAMFALGLLVAALVVGGIYWMGKKVFTVTAVSGIPLNECVRTDQHIASLIQTTDPHAIEISGRGGNSTTSISVLLIPSSGGEPKVVPLVKEVAGQGYALARIIGSDGLTLWCDAVGLFGVRLHDHSLVTAKDLQEANPSLDTHWWNDTRSMDIIDGRLHITNDDRSAGLDMDAATLKATTVAPKVSRTRFNRPAHTDYLTAGFLTPSGAWFGLHSAAELEGEFKPGQWVRAVESGDETKEQRQLCTGTTEPSSDGEYHRLKSIAPLSDATFLNAALLRLSATDAPLQLVDPTSVLMLYTSAPGSHGTLVIARVDLNGKVIWTADTGLDRFLLQRILPDANAFAFVGTRPPVEGKLSEPLVVIVDNSTGKITSHSLWR